MTALAATDLATMRDALAALRDLHWRALGNGPGLGELAQCRVCGGTGRSPHEIAHRLVHGPGGARACVVVRAREVFPRLQGD